MKPVLLTPSCVEKVNPGRFPVFGGQVDQPVSERKWTLPWPEVMLWVYTCGQKSVYPSTQSEEEYTYTHAHTNAYLLVLSSVSPLIQFRSAFMRNSTTHSGLGLLTSINLINSKTCPQVNPT